MIPGADLVIGLFIHFLLWLVMYTIKATWRAVRCCVFEHPAVSLAVLSGAKGIGWPAIALEVRSWVTWLLTNTATTVDLVQIAVSVLVYLALFVVALGIETSPWTPWLQLLLAVVAIARFVAGGGPAAVQRDVLRARHLVRDMAAWQAIGGAIRRDRNGDEDAERTTVKSWLARKLGRGPTDDTGPDTLEPPPIPMGPAAPAAPTGPAPAAPYSDAIDVREVHPDPGVTAEARPTGDPLASTTRSPQ